MPSLELLIWGGLVVWCFVQACYEVFSQPPVVRRKHPDPERVKAAYQRKLEREAVAPKASPSSPPKND